MELIHHRVQWYEYALTNYARKAEYEMCFPKIRESCYHSTLIISFVW